MTDKPNVPTAAIVILNYNSEEDLVTSAPQLAGQADVRHILILVDNASRPDSVERIKAWLVDWRPDAVIGTQDEVDTWVSNNPEDAGAAGRVYFITHRENRGYSAGNNVGIRLADKLGADAVLVANPDMRIENQHYLASLYKELLSDNRNYVAASRIVGLDNKDQSPLRESGFWEELFGPYRFLSALIKPVSYIISIKGEMSVKVPKVSGCCLLLRMSYLRSNNFLDEEVFLYCEEPILSARVRTANGHILFVPSLVAIHAHERSKKDNSSARMLLFIKSRIYYLKKYSGYNQAQLYFLALSYGLFAALHRLKLNCLGLKKHLKKGS